MKPIEMNLSVIIRKDTDTFFMKSNPNMWEVLIRRKSDNWPISIQSLDAHHIERLLDISLPRYKVIDGKFTEL
jgi:hypothetical protein